MRCQRSSLETIVTQCHGEGSNFTGFAFPEFGKVHKRDVVLQWPIKAVERVLENSVVDV